MATGSLAGMEVPITGSDSVTWIEVSVPCSSSADSVYSQPCTLLPEDAASCHIVGDPPTYLVWRIHKCIPHALELLEISAHKEFPRIGLRLIFQDALCPFAFMCKEKIQGNANNLYMLYALTVSGVAYLLKLKFFSAYASCSIFPRNDFIEVNLQNYQQFGTITTVTATVGCLVIGTNDGSVGCFHLGLLDENVPGFVHELRDDIGIGRLWGLMARGRTVGAVKELVISDVAGRRLLFVLHVDGSLQVWDLFSHIKILTHTMNIPTLAGAVIARFWVGDPNTDESLISLAILYGNTMEGGMEAIATVTLHFSFGDRIILAPKPSTHNIPLEQGRLIDVKITYDKIWILKEDGMLLYKLPHNKDKVEEAQSYRLQEAFVADQLFQGSEHSADDLIWVSQSLFLSMKDQVVPFLSSIFLRRLLQPGVHCKVALRATMKDYNKNWTDSEFQCLTVDDLKKEILLLIECEEISNTPISIIYSWKNFCTCYFYYWYRNSAPYGLMVDSSTGAVGLIRKNSLSLFRCLEDIELLVYGSFNEFGSFVSSGLDLPDDNLDREILFEVLRCINGISQQFGKAAAAVFYESFVNSSISFSEEIVPCLLKILETGCNSSVSALHLSELGVDTVWQKELAEHKNQRKFSIDMLLSLRSLCHKATTWCRVLNAIENYLKFLVPRKRMQRSNSNVSFNINTSILVQATSQVAKIMFESALDILLLLSYLVNISGQVHMLYGDVSRIQIELIPIIQEIITEWLILHFLGTTPSKSLAFEDFSSQLSSLHICDTNTNKRSWNEKLGSCNFTLASILLLNFQCSFGDNSYLSSTAFPGPNDLLSPVQEFISWIIWGMNGAESCAFFSHSTELARILLRHGQYHSVENLLAIIDAHSRKEKISQSVQSSDGGWCMRLHLLGCCLLARIQCGLQGNQKERAAREAVRCFFRASSGQGAVHALQSLSFQGSLPQTAYNGYASAASWKLHYFQWAMQIFEQYNMHEGACQFALAALEQVDEVIGLKHDMDGGDPLNEPTTTIRGRLWANVFKFTLDLNYYYDAYCAIISNPDEDSKYICLRRFIIVLSEHGANKSLCDGQLPFIGLMERVEQELFWKAARSNISARPNPYKLLYAFQMHRHNWRRAAGTMYQYSSYLRSESASKEHQQLSFVLQERVSALAAAINALNLVHPAYAWVDPWPECFDFEDENYPNKRARKILEVNSTASTDVHSQRLEFYIDTEKLEKEFVLTSAQYLLSLANVKLNFAGNQNTPSELVDLLVQTHFYDMAFTILLKFWKGSELKREMERVFVAISRNCCQNIVGSPLTSDCRTNDLLLTSSRDVKLVDMVIDGPLKMCSPALKLKGNIQWETLELYLEKYQKLHPRLPVVVAETLLHTDPQIDLPLWLIHMFKGGQRTTSWGMTGQESDPASLFRLYVDYGRYMEATNLLLEYIESFASLKPKDIIHRKKMSAVWFPYTMIESLWCQLEELRNSDHMIDQCNRLERLLHGALLNHLKLIKVDLNDAISSATC